MAIKAVGFVLNPTLGERVAMVARELVQYLAEREVDALFLGEHAMLVGQPGVEVSVFQKRAACLFSLGGDGTLLSSVKLAVPANIPVLGINLGGLGFLTELSPEDLYSGIDAFLAGRYRIDERLLLCGRVQRAGTTVKEVVCLNDCVVGRGALSRPCRLEVWVDGSRAMKFNGDGVIISTPTGSTAYSFSAGGPVVEPSVKAIIVTPICPHSFVARPMVVDVAASVEVRLETSVAGFNLTTDGQDSIPLLSGDWVGVNRYPHPFSLIRVSQRSFYCILQKKLRLEGTVDAACKE